MSFTLSLSFSSHTRILSSHPDYFIPRILFTIAKLNAITYYATNIKFIIKNSCYGTQIKKDYYLTQKRNHYLQGYIFARIIRQIDDQTIDFQLIQCQAIVCTMNIFVVWCMWKWVYCDVMWYNILSQYWLILLRNCGVVAVLLTILMTVLLWFRSPKFILCICGACTLFEDDTHKITSIHLWYKRIRTYRHYNERIFTHSHTHRRHKCTL